MTPPSQIVLVGSMGSGKSTVMEILASRLGWSGLDTDCIVEERDGRSVAEIFAVDGEQEFRSLELRALAAALAGREPVVVATGGGIVETPDARQLLETADAVVHLRVSPNVALGRISDPSSRPLLHGDAAAALVEIEERRRALWADVADVVVDVDELSPAMVADEVLGRLELAA